MPSSVKTVALVDSVIEGIELAMLHAGRWLSRAECALGALAPIEPEALADAINPPPLREPW